MKKVVVGLSGGVDSAIAAYLLKQQGFEVIGVFMRNWDSAANNDILGNPTLEDEVCSQEKDYQDAVKVAECLNIELKRIDFIKEYWDHVFTYFIEEYRKARTPNPDILCNKYVKFKSFLDYAFELGADYVATGHYAKIEHLNDVSYMSKASDLTKDQTYFLSFLSQQQLSRVLFPLGDMTKKEVRQIAHDIHLPIADKKDSTGICFIGERDFKSFLKNYLPARPGEMVDFVTKEVVGTHDGIMYYTIGQRKGLSIGGKGDAWFVIGKNYELNHLYVVQGDANDFLYTHGARIVDVHWMHSDSFKVNQSLQAKFRYRQADHEVSIVWIDDTTIDVTFKQPIKAITPGQAAVFYMGDLCLGGGVIDLAYKDNQVVEYL